MLGQRYSRGVETLFLEDVCYPSCDIRTLEHVDILETGLSNLDARKQRADIDVSICAYQRQNPDYDVVGSSNGADTVRVSKHGKVLYNFPADYAVRPRAVIDHHSMSNDSDDSSTSSRGSFVTANGNSLVSAALGAEPLNPPPAEDAILDPMPTDDAAPDPTPTDDVTPDTTGDAVPDSPPAADADAVSDPTPTNDAVSDPPPAGDADAASDPTPTADAAPDPTPTNDAVPDPTPTDGAAPDPFPPGDAAPDPPPVADAAPDTAAKAAPDPAADADADVAHVVEITLPFMTGDAIPKTSEEVDEEASYDCAFADDDSSVSDEDSVISEREIGEYNFERPSEFIVLKLNESYRSDLMQLAEATTSLFRSSKKLFKTIGYVLY